MSTCVVLLVEGSASISNLSVVCEQLSVAPLIVESISEVASALRRHVVPLVVVASNRLMNSPAALFKVVGQVKTRLVLFGPEFGGPEHLLGLELGFQEVWPADLSPLAITALMRVCLRDWNRSLSNENRHILTIGSVILDRVKGSCKNKEVEVVLSRTCFDALAMLVEKFPNMVSREELMSEFFPKTGRSHSPRGIDVLISRIRRYLHDGGVYNLRIMHIRGLGYRIETVN